MTEKMWLVLEVLKDEKVRTPNEIGYEIGVQPIGGAQYKSRGPGSIIAPVLTNLNKRRLIWRASRPDGLSGTAYHITDRGLAKLETKDRHTDSFAVAWDGMLFDLHSELVRGEARYYWVQMRPNPDVGSVRCKLLEGTVDGRKAKKLPHAACARYEASLPWP